MAAKLWWLIHKDLISEFRARQVWPAMLLFGTVVALVFSVQMDLLPSEKRRLVGGLLWLAIFFAGMLAIDRSFASEREDGCWEGLRLYPLAPTAVYLAKLVVNLVALAALECVLMPLFVVLADVPLLARPGPMLAVALMANLAIASVGTLLSALTATIRAKGNLLVLLVLPMVIPVLLAAAEATRLAVEGHLGTAWCNWVQLLGACAIVFLIAGAVLFDSAVEE